MALIPLVELPVLCVHWGHTATKAAKASVGQGLRPLLAHPKPVTAGPLFMQKPLPVLHGKGVDQHAGVIGQDLL